MAVIITELIAESKDENSPLVIGFLDAQKAFDVLGHDSVIRKLYLAGIVGGGGGGILSMNGIRILYPVLNGKETTLESLMKIREYVKVAFGHPPHIRHISILC